MNWTTHTQSNLQASDFTIAADAETVPPITTGPHPDFSATGAPITFGYLTTNGTPSTSYTVTGGVDNWSVDVHVPEPASLSVLALGALPLLRRRR